MALHTGEARLRDDLYYAGPSIIHCARLRALAHGGQILVSASTADLLADALPDDSTLLPLGRHRLKGLRTPEDVYQLAHPLLPISFPPLPTVDGRPTNVPIQLTSFIGRRTELDELTDLITRHRLVTVVGGGGFGKTRMAAQTAGECAEAFADGVWWVELADVAEPGAVPEAVLAAIGLDARGFPPLDPDAAGALRCAGEGAVGARAPRHLRDGPAARVRDGRDRRGDRGGRGDRRRRDPRTGPGEPGHDDRLRRPAGGAGRARGGTGRRRAGRRSLRAGGHRRLCLPGGRVQRRSRRPGGTAPGRVGERGRNHRQRRLGDLARDDQRRRAPAGRAPARGGRVARGRGRTGLGPRRSHAGVLVRRVAGRVPRRAR